MKNIILILTAFAIVSCGGGEKNKSIEKVISSGDLSAIKAKRSELVAKYDAELEQLDEAIEKLDTTSKASLITIITAKDTLFNHYVELQGSVDTKQNIVINAEYPGNLLKVFVKEGQAVKKGQLLAKIDDGGLSAQLSQLQVQADLAETTFERQKRLWEQKIGSEIQYLQAKSQFESTQNAVAQIRSQLSKTSVVAPFSGTIDEIITDQGSNVSAGVPLMRIVNLNDMYIDVEVPEKYLANIKKGTSVKVNFPVLGDTITSKVRQVSNYINPGNRAFKVEVEVPNHKGLIKPNLTARVSINDYTSEKAILIPQSIISENADGEQYAYVVTGKNTDNIAKAHRVIIKTGKTQGDYIEVLEGIKDGDSVIKEGARRVHDNQKVKIKTL
ncbi:efflux RND transporter periplasmic adaptor subunit [Abyssalbus ytuae]|uniref:Efflux RND transporter periplasmic adaptor subunit n=1 Tax=Abyssalbus ytuae TaxID=2926907 RepID=A0A9E6ZKP7_9FLAO|nr:efflux RND transporter periplasmic adaptor subunit [Abyssalbus ytuae]UOB15980.1 efflux RND transporter periplasmic adaptor subunit [Abyssalbus ytuae]